MVALLFMFKCFLLFPTARTQEICVSKVVHQFGNTNALKTSKVAKSAFVGRPVNLVKSPRCFCKNILNDLFMHDLECVAYYLEAITDPS
jgi:hypothetical protein